MMASAFQAAILLFLDQSSLPNCTTKFDPVVSETNRITLLLKCRTLCTSVTGQNLLNLKPYLHSRIPTEASDSFLKFTYCHLLTFDDLCRNAHRQQALWSTQFPHQMWFSATWVRRLFRDCSLQGRDAFYQSCHAFAWHVQLVPCSFPCSEPHQFEKGKLYCSLTVAYVIHQFSPFYRETILRFTFGAVLIAPTYGMNGAWRNL